MDTKDMNALLRTEDVSVGYGGVPLIKAVDLELQRGEICSLIGSNGSGKSTLLRTLAGLQRPLSGNIQLDGRSLLQLSSMERARLLSVVLTEKPLVGSLDVRTLVSLGRHPWTGNLGRLGAEDHTRVNEALVRTGTLDLAERAWSDLSDGEGQKVLIARAVAQDTPVLLLDEPTAFLDVVNRVAIMRLLRTIAHSLNRTVLLSTHDLATALQLCDRILLVHDGVLWAGSSAEALDSGVLHKAFAAEGMHFDPATASLIVDP